MVQCEKPCSGTFFRERTHYDYLDHHFEIVVESLEALNYFEVKPTESLSDES